MSEIDGFETSVRFTWDKVTCKTFRGAAETGITGIISPSSGPCVPHRSSTLPGTEMQRGGRESYL